jgi:hypothetical protein
MVTGRAPATRSTPSKASGVRLTPRDLAALGRLTRFGVLAAEHLGPGPYPGPAVAAGRLAVLARAGYVRVERPSYRGRIAYLVTAAGARAGGTGLPAPRFTPALVRHHFAVADLATLLLRLYPGAHWLTERELRHQTDRPRRAGRHRLAGPGPLPDAGHPPDGLVVLGALRVAVEVELTPKTAASYRRILRWYAGALDVRRVVWFCHGQALCRRLAALIQEEGVADFVAVRPLPAEVDAGSWG